MGIHWYMLSRLIILVLALSVGSLAQNLLVNGDFENGTVKGQFSNGYPSGWTGWSVNGWHHGDSGYKKGAYGIAIWSNDTGCFQNIAASGGSSFQVSGEMIYSTTEVLVNKKAYLKIEFWNTTTKLSQTEVGILTPTHTAGTWYTFSSPVTTPAGTTQVRILCYTASITGGTSTGKAYWDNIVVDNLVTINNPDYNDDLKVNLLDFAKLASVWNKNSADYNLIGSNYIDIADLGVMAAAWLDELPVYPGYALVWSDEFDGTQLDTNNWTYQIMGDGGNNELQYYTSRAANSWVANGVLTIQANKENYTVDNTTYNYTSARLRTAGKQDFLYGKLEARIKIPKGQGIWPAFWMMPTDSVYGGWAASGEIDIMESIGQANTIYGTNHFGGSWPNNTSSGGSYADGTDYSQDFHVYGIEWDTNAFRWYLDGQLYYTLTSWWSSGGAYPAPFNQPFHFILNVAVGGNWPGYPDATTVFPQQMQIDYVRVYQKTTP
jgi:hypothetical protein